ncbi:MAG TPA: hypothetical protein VF635_11985 [Propionibacteriaceae bacterium]|jgi:hypothetical protein
MTDLHLSCPPLDPVDAIDAVDQETVPPELLPPACATADGPVVPGPGVSVELTLHAHHRERFYELYLEAFGPMRTLAPARQVLHHDEFLDEMADPRVLKYVAWDHEGEPVALATLTSDLSTVPWISPEYFAARYPEQAARRAVYYLGFALAHPTRRSTPAFRQVFVTILHKLAREKAVCAYDMCGFNNQTVGLAQHIETVGGQLVDGFVEVLDTQTYYGATFR